MGYATCFTYAARRCGFSVRREARAIIQLVLVCGHIYLGGESLGRADVEIRDEIYARAARESLSLGLCDDGAVSNAFFPKTETCQFLGIEH